MRSLFGPFAGVLAYLSLASVAHGGLNISNWVLSTFAEDSITSDWQATGSSIPVTGLLYELITADANNTTSVASISNQYYPIAGNGSGYLWNPGFSYTNLDASFSVPTTRYCTITMSSAAHGRDGVSMNGLYAITDNLDTDNVLSGHSYSVSLTVPPESEEETEVNASETYIARLALVGGKTYVLSFHTDVDSTVPAPNADRFYGGAGIIIELDPESPFLKGDLNGDGLFDIDDEYYYIEALINDEYPFSSFLDMYSSTFAANYDGLIPTADDIVEIGDLNNDGIFDMDDFDQFETLVNPPSRPFAAAIPEPTLAWIIPGAAIALNRRVRRTTTVSK